MNRKHFLILFSLTLLIGCATYSPVYQAPENPADITFLTTAVIDNLDWDYENRKLIIRDEEKITEAYRQMIVSWLSGSPQAERTLNPVEEQTNFNLANFKKEMAADENDPRFSNAGFFEADTFTSILIRDKVAFASSYTPIKRIEDDGKTESPVFRHFLELFPEASWEDLVFLYQHGWFIYQEEQPRRLSEEEIPADLTIVTNDDQINVYAVPVRGIFVTGKDISYDFSFYEAKTYALDEDNLFSFELLFSPEENLLEDEEETGEKGLKAIQKGMDGFLRVLFPNAGRFQEEENQDDKSDETEASDEETADE